MESHQKKKLKIKKKINLVKDNKVKALQVVKEQKKVNNNQLQEQ